MKEQVSWYFWLFSLIVPLFPIILLLVFPLVRLNLGYFILFLKSGGEFLVFSTATASAAIAHLGSAGKLGINHDGAAGAWGTALILVFIIILSTGTFSLSLSDRVHHNDDDSTITQKINHKVTGKDRANILSSIAFAGFVIYFSYYAHFVVQLGHEVTYVK